jgi:hypothetical protein
MRGLVGVVCALAGNAVTSITNESKIPVGFVENRMLLLLQKARTDMGGTST